MRLMAKCFGFGIRSYIIKEKNLLMMKNILTLLLITSNLFSRCVPNNTQ